MSQKTVSKSKGATRGRQQNKAGKRGSNHADIEVTQYIGYGRVSTNEQADSGLSLELQRARITSYGEANGWSCKGFYEDAGISGSSLARPALAQAMSQLGPGVVLVVWKLNRLTRSMRDMCSINDALHELGSSWACVMEKYDTSTPGGRMLMDFMVRIAQFEAEDTSEKTINALAMKKVRGEFLGTPPLGYRSTVGSDGIARIEVDADEMATVELARRLWDDGRGLSLRKIAQELSLAGCTTKRGGGWAASTIKKIVEPRYIETLQQGLV